MTIESIEKKIKMTIDEYIDRVKTEVETADFTEDSGSTFSVDFSVLSDEEFLFFINLLKEKTV